MWTSSGAGRAVLFESPGRVGPPALPSSRPSGGLGWTSQPSIVPPCGPAKARRSTRGSRRRPEERLVHAGEPPLVAPVPGRAPHVAGLVGGAGGEREPAPARARRPELALASHDGPDAAVRHRHPDRVDVAGIRGDERQGRPVGRPQRARVQLERRVQERAAVVPRREAAGRAAGHRHRPDPVERLAVAGLLLVGAVAGDGGAVRRPRRHDRPADVLGQTPGIPAIGVRHPQVVEVVVGRPRAGPAPGDPGPVGRPGRGAVVGLPVRDPGHRPVGHPHDEELARPVELVAGPVGLVGRAGHDPRALGPAGPGRGVGRRRLDRHPRGEHEPGPVG